MTLSEIMFIKAFDGRVSPNLNFRIACFESLFAKCSNPDGYCMFLNIVVAMLGITTFLQINVLRIKDTECFTRCAYTQFPKSSIIYCK